MQPLNDFNNLQVAALPSYLKQYVVEQQYEHYTPVDQAVWRYIMRQNYAHLKDTAYYPYIPGLKAAGLTIERIPDLQEMNDALGRIGWGAVTVDGFIPPAAFMDFQAHRVLVIAADIRQLEHIQYTPAPDIIHESAGHAPIIADKAYHEYLSYFGSIGAKAMYSAEDFRLYEAIRELSVLKETPGASGDDIKAAEERVTQCQAAIAEPSEMALLSRLHWWTVEYGLIGTLENPKIFGAGLLSSIGESASCMDAGIPKLWYSIDAINYPFDITKEQPQLFVTPSFARLTEVLEEFASGMAFRRGGKEGVLKAITSGNVCTVVFSSGLQVSGLFENLICDSNDEPAFIKAKGPCALSLEGSQLPGHGKDYHKAGYSSPVGRLKNYSEPLEDFNDRDLEIAGIREDHVVELAFESGITLSGKLASITRNYSKILLLTFSFCEMHAADGSLLYSQDWGPFDMAVGEKIVSVFNGAADKDAYENTVKPAVPPPPLPVYDEKTLAYHHLFATVRRIREAENGYYQLAEVWYSLKKDFPEDWLCSLEILELLEKRNLFFNLTSEIRAALIHKEYTEPQLSKLIRDGFNLVSHPVHELV
ncbi:aromatic amino acid hydroxylase [Desertivirga xinjiangensis]|uniref:aromatic amino acid hydroxylase n=1 Tax=Desertivirga xinjiangensis TaxID=539206 RepID=UPI00210D0611|nr:aromatic amino acid hydroxylase [Pedobacter xinjiangensis]